MGKTCNTNKRRYSNGVILLIVCIHAVFLVAYGAIFYGWIKSCEKVSGEYSAIKSDCVVEAQLSEVSPVVKNNKKNGAVKYNVIYQYVDADITYSGVGIYEVEDYAKAEEYIGLNIEIYIDGQGHSIVVGQNPQWAALICVTMLVVILFYPLALFPLLFYQVDKWNEKRKKAAGQTPVQTDSQNNNIEQFM